MKIIAPAALLCLFAASACAGPAGTYPSLAPRAVETVADQPEVETVSTPAPADAGTKAQLETLVADAERGESAFAAALPATERAISSARGSSAASETWIAAQQQLSALDAARAPTASSMIAIDSLFIALADKATANASVGGVEEAQAARDSVQTLYDRQIEKLSLLQGALSPP